MLAALALLAVSLWLKRLGKKNAFTRYPMIVMFAVTITALISLIVKNVMSGNFALALIAVFLLFVAVVLAVQAFHSMRNFGTSTSSKSEAV